MLTAILEKGYFTFADRFSTWQEAIKGGCAPLVAGGVVDETYSEQIIDSINTYGPYIVIAPLVALPHTQEKAAGVKDTAVGFMRVREPVAFDRDDRSKDAQIFFTLASQDHQKHLHNLTALANALDDENIITALCQAENEADLREIARRFSC